ncbi:MAG: type IV pilin N-terminal domain-containing protein, partial [Archaeoglobaceae archaeon]
MMIEKATSSVVAVILMVAITVILAVAIVNFAAGMAGGVKKTYLVSASAIETNCDPIAELCDIEITYHGGIDHPAVIDLKVIQPEDCNEFPDVLSGSVTICS